VVHPSLCSWPIPLQRFVHAAGPVALQIEGNVDVAKGFERVDDALAYRGVGKRRDIGRSDLDARRFPIAPARAHAHRGKTRFDEELLGGVDPCEDLRDCIDDVAYVHLKDKAGEANVWDFPAVGKGWINFPGFFKQLEDKGNNSPYSIEIEFTAAGPKDIEEVNQAVKDSAAYLIAQGYTL